MLLREAVCGRAANDLVGVLRAVRNMSRCV